MTGENRKTSRPSRRWEAGRYTRVAMLLPVLALIGAGRAGATGADALRCEALSGSMQGQWPDATTRILSAVLRSRGPFAPPSMPGSLRAPAPITLPEHCDILGIMRERVGFGGQHYAIRFHLRLPTSWNGRFFFQGGGGSDGVVGDALGPTAKNAPPAIVQGFAVVSQDSGHDNAFNSDPARGGAVAFGFDAEARADYGHASLPAVADAAKAAVKVYYGKAPRFSYFVGCSKGGQEGMAFAQRYPDEFDGIVAAAPGFSLPRAAVAEAWNVQSIAALVPPRERMRNLPDHVADTFSDADLRLVSDAILSVCDADDGIKDGIIGDFMRCTDVRVRPVVEETACSGGKSPGCLSKDQLTALERIFAGARDGAGHSLYSDWQWDAGIAAPGWRIWELGSENHKIPALNIALGGASLAAVFTTPPTQVAADPQSSANYQLSFSFDRDAAKIYSTDARFTHSAWEDIAARSGDLARFRAHGGKLIVPQGVSDPVFSIRDTLDWYRAVESRYDGRAQRFARVFPVPGMNHCGGGPATDEYDAFTALTEWVERGKAPDRILATAGAGSPWPGRTRPLCPFPKTAHYKGAGNIESADSFVCR
jgi:feruloyl esterase